MSSHGSASKEASRGQLQLTPEDLRFGGIFNLALLEPGDPPTSRHGTPRIEGRAVLGGVVYHFAAVVRRRQVVLLTMFKSRSRNEEAHLPHALLSQSFGLRPRRW